jgi:hypothetical protein
MVLPQVNALSGKAHQFPMRFLSKARWSTDDFNTPQLMVAPQEKASSGGMHQLPVRSLSVFWLVEGGL